MITTLAGPQGTASAGQEIDVAAKTGTALIQGGYAQAVKAPVETATVAAPERAVTRRARPRKATRKK